MNRDEKNRYVAEECVKMISVLRTIRKTAPEIYNTIIRESKKDG